MPLSAQTHLSIAGRVAFHRTKNESAMLARHSGGTWLQPRKYTFAFFFLQPSHATVVRGSRFLFGTIRGLDSIGYLVARPLQPVWETGVLSAILCA